MTHGIIVLRRSPSDVVRAGYDTAKIWMGEIYTGVNDTYTDRVANAG
jgi:hypothetical protein